VPPDEGLAAIGPEVELAYDSLEYGENNDCPEADAPEGVISLTIAGRQIGGIGRFTLCIGRPDLFGQALELGPDEVGVPVRIIDVTGEANGCSFSFDDTVAPTGTARTEGLCDAGADLSGFTLIVDGTVTLERDCGGVIDTVDVTLAGRITALPQP
jgi:hypothetical protein